MCAPLNMKYVIVVLIFACTGSAENAKEKRGLNSFSFGFQQYGYGSPQYLGNQLSGLHGQSGGELQEFTWPVESTLRLPSVENQLHLPSMSAGYISVPKAVLPARAIPSPAPVTTPPPEPPQPPQSPLLNTQPAVGQLGAGSLGYASLENGALSIGSGALGYAALPQVSNNGNNNPITTSTQGQGFQLGTDSLPILNFGYNFNSPAPQYGLPLQNQQAPQSFSQPEPPQIIPPNNPPPANLFDLSSVGGKGFSMDTGSLGYVGLSPVSNYGEKDSTFTFLQDQRSQLGGGSAFESQKSSPSFDYSNLQNNYLTDMFGYGSPHTMSQATLPITQKVQFGPMSQGHFEYSKGFLGSDSLQSQSNFRPTFVRPYLRSRHQKTSFGGPYGLP